MLFPWKAVLFFEYDRLDRDQNHSVFDSSVKRMDFEKASGRSNVIGASLNEQRRSTLRGKLPYSKYE